MKIKSYLLILFVLSFAGLVSTGWTQSEPVTGYYDPINDWFVFEWDRPNYGKTTTIYDPTNKVKPLIRAKVEFNTNEQDYMYMYNYEVTNQEGAVQLLDTIFVKHLAPIYDAKAPVPAEDWHMGEYKNKEAWHWAKTLGTPTGIPAGQTIGGFSFKSKGLPTILNSAFLGEERAEFSGPGDYDTDEVEESFERVFTRLKEKYKEKFEYIIKRTIGPTAPPADFKPIDFLNNIINMKHEAFSLGWIKNKGIENSLDAKLDNTKKKIEQGNITAAKNILNAFLNEVEAQGCETYEKCPEGKHLTSEAYALLKYNVQYLIEHL